MNTKKILFAVAAFGMLAAAISIPNNNTEELGVERSAITVPKRA
jgi:hypothetical protein